MLLLNRIRSLFRREKLESDLDDELKFHVEMKTRENLAAGMPPEEARSAALKAFGNVTRAMENTRTAWTFPRPESIVQDVRYGVRQLRRNPGFTAVAVLTLALGIGGTTAIFSVIHGVLIDPWPYRDSDRLAVLEARDTTNGLLNWALVSAPEWLDYQQQNRVFDEVIGGTFDNVRLTGSGTAEDYYGILVTGNLFHVLGVPPLLGRSITPADANPGAPPVVVLSHKVWQGKFGGDPGVIGRTLVLNHQPTTVMGIMPQRFGFGGADLWLPTTISRSGSPGQKQYFFEGRLKPGVSFKQATADITVLAQRFAKVYPRDHPKDVTFTVESFTFAFTSHLRPTWGILLGAVGLLLLIACVNVANLLLARATTREKEIAVRAALGASRGRLVHQFLIESLVLALGGAILGCLLAWNLLGGLLAIIPPGSMPGEVEIRINGSVLLFTIGTSLLCTLLFGLAPALLAVRRDPQEPLKATGRGAGESPGHSRLRNLLVVSEVVLSLVLLTGAGLLLRSFWALRHVELGYNVGNVLRAGAALPEERYKTAEQKNQFHLESLRRVRALPGVVSAAAGWPTLNFAVSAQIEITGQTGAESQSAWFRGASDRFFETLGIHLLQGRAISEEDMVHARPVVVVNRAFVNKYFAGKNPLGRQIKVTPPPWFPPIKEAGFEIVGVVADTRHSDGTEPTVQPQIYLPSTVTGVPWEGLFVRTAGEPASLANAVRREFASMDKELAVEAVPMGQDFQDWYSEPRFVMAMLIGFAALGMILVCIGIYGVLSYAVSRRTQEIGIRMALGAGAADVRRWVLKAGLRWLLVGIGIGVPASIALAKILQNRIWGIKSADPMTLLIVSLVLTAVGLAACYFPARRATKVDPMVALRYE